MVDPQKVAEAAKALNEAEVTFEEARRKKVAVDEAMSTAEQRLADARQAFKTAVAF